MTAAGSGSYRQYIRRKWAVLILLCLLTAIFSIMSLLSGSVNMTFSEGIAGSFIRGRCSDSLLRSRNTDQLWQWRVCADNHPAIYGFSCGFLRRNAYNNPDARLVEAQGCHTFGDGSCRSCAELNVHRWDGAYPVLCR